MHRILNLTVLALALAVAAFGADNSVGTWKLNVDQSTYTPAPFPVKSLTTVREASDGGVKVTTTGETAGGAPINASYTAKYGGPPATITGTGSPYDTISLQRVNANRFTDERKKTGGPYKATGHTEISNGGKTMTTTTKGINGDGKAFTSKFVFEKQ